MEPKSVFLLFLLAALVYIPSASSKRSARNLGVYRSPSSGPSPDIGNSPSSGSSPDVGSSPTYTTPTTPSGSSPVDQSPPSYTPTTPSSGSSPVTEAPPTDSGSSPVLSPPYGSTTPTSGSSPTTGSPLSSPVIGSPLSSPVVGSPISSPVVGTPTTTTPTIGSPLSSPTPVILTPPTTPSGGYSGGGRGSCDHWKSSGAKWPSILSALGSLARIFGGRAPSVFGNRMTLMQALLNPNQDEFSALARQGTASLLNAYTVENFAWSPEEVRQQFNDALVSPDLARQQALKFEHANIAV